MSDATHHHHPLVKQTKLGDVAWEDSETTSAHYLRSLHLPSNASIVVVGVSVALSRMSLSLVYGVDEMEEARFLSVCSSLLEQIGVLPVAPASHAAPIDGGVLLAYVCAKLATCAESSQMQHVSHGPA